MSQPQCMNRVEATRDHGIVPCGWGRLILAQTFAQPEEIARVLEQEDEGERDVAFYVRDPHLVLAAAPQSLFLDPSLSFRLPLAQHEALAGDTHGLTVRTASVADEQAINRLYMAWNMVPLARGAVRQVIEQPTTELLVAEDQDGAVTGVVMGVDHYWAIADPQHGASLWALAVDPQSPETSVGEALVVTLANRFAAAGARYLDLSVMHDNDKAIALYQKLGFARVAVYCVKRKNPINERLYIGPEPDEELNSYARIIIDEARRRGIGIEVEDAAAGLFRLTLGGRSVACRESLSEFTDAVAMSRCDDKALTNRLLRAAGIEVPAQANCSNLETAAAFLARHECVVVKPARGEQGQGITVGVRNDDELASAVDRAATEGSDVLLEAMHAGLDLRLIVIDDELVAAAVRRPPCVRGDGRHNIADLIERQSRRRAAATQGESRIPIDEETRRCVEGAGYALDDVLGEGEELIVRKTANLHTGGTIEDVTPVLHRDIATAARRCAQALGIPVVGMDFIVGDPRQSRYVAIEANERPGLANHEPQPTAKKFVDFLFPQTRNGAC